MIHHRLLLVVAALLMTACIAVPKQRFDARAHPEIRTLGIADIEYNHRISIRRNNPVFALIGISGLLVQQWMMEKISRHYESRVGDSLAMACEASVMKGLRRNLKKSGFKVRMLHIGFWQAIKLAHAHRLRGVDAVLRVRIKQLGFRAGSITAPLSPSLIVTASLVEPRSKEILYTNTVAMGYNPRTSHMTVLKQRGSHSYPDFKALLAHARESRNDLLAALDLASDHIARELGRGGTALATSDTEVAAHLE